MIMRWGKEFVLLAAGLTVACFLAAGANAQSAQGNQSGNGPTPTDAGPAPDRALIDELVVASRILFEQGVVDAFGHVSVRHDKNPDRFLLARNLAPALVTASDIMEFDLDGNAVNSDGRRVFLERFIHSAIYRARSDVQAVVHGHAPEVVPFSAVKSAPLKPVWVMSGFLGEGAPVFEIRDVAGDGTNLLVSDGALGEALAQALGSASVVLMRDHGAVVVGSDLKETVVKAVYTKMNAEIQMRAHQLGDVTFLSPAEAQATSGAVSAQAGRAWDLWKRQIEIPSDGD